MLFLISYFVNFILKNEKSSPCYGAVFKLNLVQPLPSLGCQVELLNYSIAVLVVHLSFVLLIQVFHEIVQVYFEIVQYANYDCHEQQLECDVY